MAKSHPKTARAAVAPVKLARRRSEAILLTPAHAMELLEHNTLNRPLTQTHVDRIARQILDGKWRYNGDTIKIGANGEILDGQHRLWAVIEAKVPVETVVVYGIDREAFATIDTIRKPRSGGDILALNGVTVRARETAAALAWLLRWQRNALEAIRAPQNRVENSDIEEAYRHNPGMVRAIERVRHLRGLVSPAIIGFVYYAVAGRNADLAERLACTLEDPAGVPLDDPFFRLRQRLLGMLEQRRRREPVATIALIFKAVNAAARGETVEKLMWRNQGPTPESFPRLEV